MLIEKVIYEKMSVGFVWWKGEPFKHVSLGRMEDCGCLCLNVAEELHLQWVFRKTR